ncbi:hypothetical protein KKA15_01815 [Patescibacteria group bacterium]|nr:hypothetical protein [Patescibacteria group bacterium]
MKKLLLIVVSGLLLSGCVGKQEAKVEDPDKSIENVNEIPLIESDELIELEEQAISLVKKIPEVIEWISLFSEPNGSSPKTGGFPAFRVDRVEGPVYSIQVFENMPTQTSTFNWYDVNIETKEIEQSI